MEFSITATVHETSRNWIYTYSIPFVIPHLRTGLNEQPSLLLRPQHDIHISVGSERVSRSLNSCVDEVEHICLLEDVRDPAGGVQGGLEGAVASGGGVSSVGCIGRVWGGSVG